MSKPVAVQRMAAFEIDHQQYLGRGQYGAVFAGKDLATQEKIAIKVIDLARRNNTELRYLLQETTVMKKLCHPNVIRLLYDEKSKDGKTLYLAMEFCGGGDLKSFLDRQPGRCIDEETARDFMIQFAAGLKHLHLLGIVHRDLKPQNLLLTNPSKDATIKIADLGFARSVDNQPYFLSMVGTPLYMAPEVYSGSAYDAKADLWSTGCILYEMLTGQTPLAPRDHRDLTDKLNSPLPTMTNPPKVSPLCLHLLEGLLQKNPKSRMNWDKFLQHEYLQPPKVNVPSSPRSTPSPPPPSPTTKVAEVKPAAPAASPKKSNAPDISRFAWLQTFRIFHFHGNEVTLHLRPTNYVREIVITLGKMMNIDTKEILLVTGDGTEMRIDTVVETYKLPEKSLKVHVFPASVFRGQKYNVTSYEFDKFAEPSPEPLPEIPVHENKLIMEAMTVRSQKEEKLRQAAVICERLTYRFTQVLKAQVSNSYQEDSLMLVTGPWLIQVHRALTNKVKVLIETFKEHEAETRTLIEAKDQVLSMLRGTEFDIRFAPNLNPAQTATIKTLDAFVSFLNNSDISTDFKNLKEDYNSLTKLLAEGTKNLDKLKHFCDNASATFKLDLRPVQALSDAKGQLGGNLKNAEEKKEKIQSKFQQASLALNTAISELATAWNKGLPKIPELEANLQTQIKSPLFVEIDVLYSDLLQLDKKSEAVLDKVREYKNEACKQNFESLEQRAKIFLEIPDMLKPWDHFVPAAKRLTATLPKCRLASRFHNFYTAALEEVARRNEYSTRLAAATASYNKYLADLHNREVVARHQNRELLLRLGVPPTNFAPFIFEDGEPLEPFHVELPPIDASLPVVQLKSKERIKNDDVDDFELIDSDDPKELRQRNHDLEARIAYLMKLLEDSNKQIAQLEKEKAEKKPAEPFLLLQDLSEQLEATEKEKLIFAEHLKDTQADLTRYQAECSEKTKKLGEALAELELVKKNYDEIKAKIAAAPGNQQFILADAEKREDEQILSAAAALQLPRDEITKIISKMRKENRHPTPEAVINAYFQNQGF